MCVCVCVCVFVCVCVKLTFRSACPLHQAILHFGSEVPTTLLYDYFIRQ